MLPLRHGPAAALTLGLALAGLVGGAVPASAHDIYSNLYSGGAPGVGQWCCNGDAVTGDCEAVGTSYRVEPNGDAIITSRRYKRDVRVGREKITWLPVAGGESSEAHWCGKPRAAMWHAPQEPAPEQPDDTIWTFCTFITPGGV